jgi:6-phosphogluconolactonase
MIKVFPDIEELNNFAAERFIEIGNRAIEEVVIFLVALSGGSTPKSLYQLLASEKFRNKIDWRSIFFFITDERNVPETDAESNFRMINENLFEPLQIPAINIYRWHAGIKDPKETAKDYRRTMLVSCVEDEDGRNHSRFHLMLLGMGADGHTASLFPYTKALKAKRRAVANYVEKLQTTRLTMTFPVINGASNAMFLVSGTEKAEALREVHQGEYQPEKFPAQKVKLTDGNLLWLVDSEAARLLQ